MPEAQAFSRWTEPAGTLGLLVTEARNRVEALRGHARALEAQAQGAPRPPSFAAALDGGDVAVIAEIKRRSPSRGVLNAGMDAPRQALAYASGGARALSVLTEPRHFGGSGEDVARVRAAVALPVLKKDFHVDPLQALEARALGASALLLIARALAPEKLRTMARAARDAGLEVLVEIRDERELDVALGTEAGLIGVNTRDLETLEIDRAVAARLLPLVPSDRIAIHESGVRTRADVEAAAADGADAVLVGSTLSAASDPVAAVRVLAGVVRVNRRSRD